MKNKKQQKKKYSEHCNDVLIDWNTGKPIYCQKIPGHDDPKNSELARPHECSAYSWEGKGSKTLKEYGTSGVFTFCINDLWLTSGGRIVKPGHGEICKEPYDIKLMTDRELQNGIRLEEFQRRLDEAILKRRMKEGICPRCDAKHGDYSRPADAIDIAMDEANDGDCRLDARKWLLKKVEGILAGD